MNSDFIVAIEQLEKQRNISKDMLLDAVRQAIINAYKKHYGYSGDIQIKINEENGDFQIFSPITIVDDETEDIMDSEMTAEYASRIYERDYKPGDIIMEEVFPENFGRIATQAARQIIVQKIREAENDVNYDELKKREGEMLTGTVSRISKSSILIDISIISNSGITINVEGIMPQTEQVKGENYFPGKRLKVYVLEVKKNLNKSQVILSRSHPGLIKRLFEAEVPEIYDGTVLISSIAREAGSRTKMAVYSEDQNVDPIGACVGNKGARVNEVVLEIGGEKIDIIEYSENPMEYISASLSPAKVISIEIKEGEKVASVIVPDDKLSLAIGKEGQNVRLAAKLTGWKIDINSKTQSEKNNHEETAPSLENPFTEENKIEGEDSADD